MRKAACSITPAPVITLDILRANSTQLYEVNNDVNLM